MKIYLSDSKGIVIELHGKCIICESNEELSDLETEIRNYLIENDYYEGV